jgi:ferritin
MIIKEKVQDAINKQINRELYSSYLYVAMAAYFESVNLPGFAHWMRVQANEENAHAMRFYDYVVARGGRVTLDSIEKPPVEWKSPLDVFENAYKHELKVTEMINGLVKLARAENDYATEEALQWFVKEQVEEEENPFNIIQQLKKAKDSAGALMWLDHELSERK